MIYDVSVPMALVDFIPVLLFPGRSRRSKATALAVAPPTPKGRRRCFYALFMRAAPFILSRTTPAAPPTGRPR